MLRASGQMAAPVLRAAVPTVAAMNGCIVCIRKARLWARAQQRRVPYGQRELRQYRETGCILHLDPHAEWQCVRRCVSTERLRHRALAGEVLYQWGPREFDEIGRLLVMVRDEGRMLHVVLSLLSGGRGIAIRTVYSPATRPWQWSADLRRRVCWCVRDDVDD